MNIIRNTNLIKNNIKKYINMNLNFYDYNGVLIHHSDINNFNNNNSNLNNKLLCTLTDNYKHKGDCECTNKCLEISNYVQLYNRTILPGC